jgi:hypothetical protein
MDYKKVDAAMAFVHSQARKNDGEVPAWDKYENLVRERFSDEYTRKPKMPKEYYYAYLRVKGLSDQDARARMGIETNSTTKSKKEKPFWKFW